MTVELLYRGALGPQPGGNVQLLFGALDDPIDPPPVDLPLGLLRAGCSASWRRAERVAPTALAAPWRAAQRLGAAWVLPSTMAAPVATVAHAQWGSTDPVRPAGVRLPWGQAGAVRPAGVRLPWGQAIALAAGWGSGWRGAAAATGAVLVPWGQGLRTGAPAHLPWGQGLQTRAPVLAPWAGGTRMPGAVRAPWQAGVPIESIGGPWAPPPLFPDPPIPCYQPDPGDDVLLLFRESLTGLAALIFACRRAALAVVPIRRVYMVTNVTSLVRVSDSASIPCLGFSLSLDVDSWAWGFSASVQPNALPLLEPDVGGTPVELAAWVNGTQFRVLVESIGSDRSFGQRSLRLQGRGATAVLDAPTSPIVVFSETDALTSQQLLDQALPAGWSATFSLTPWTVPGGVWSHQGTPITAAVAIAQAGGGYVQPHPSAQSISVLPLYPVAPWAWGTVTPDVELPAAYATREGIEWVELPRYNRVYVSGTTAGVLGRVTRAGTAGDILAPMVTDPLITHTDAARQRGLPILAKTGRIAFVTLRLPEAEGTGVIQPGKFVRYVDGATTRLGLVRSVAVDVVGHQVWQTLRLETFA